MIDEIEYQHFFYSLLDAIPWPMLVVDRDLAICYYNRLALQLLRATEPLQGVKLNQIVQEPMVSQLVQRSIQTGQAQQAELDYGSSNVVWKVSVSPLEHTANQLSASLTTRRKAKKQQDMIATATSDYVYFTIAIEDLSELRRLERARRDFIANVSHELRTPLSSVRLLAETLEEAIDTDPEQAQVFVEKIENEVQHLTELVSELLELSRIESGLIPMTFEPVEAELLVREVMARMLPQAQRHRVSLRTEIEQNKTFVMADSKQIARVLVNLVHNAIKFTPSGGMVVIGTHLEGKPSKQQRQQRQQMQTFFVRDSGVGIRPEELSRVFERFYKADRARSKANYIGPGGGGSGLGLAIARHVVEAHKGRIIAESTPGQGSVFSFTLPVAAHGMSKSGEI